MISWRDYDYRPHRKNGTELELRNQSIRNIHWDYALFFTLILSFCSFIWINFVILFGPAYKRCHATIVVHKSLFFLNSTKVIVNSPRYLQWSQCPPPMILLTANNPKRSRLISNLRIPNFVIIADIGWTIRSEFVVMAMQTMAGHRSTIQGISRRNLHREREITCIEIPMPTCCYNQTDWNYLTSLTPSLSVESSNFHCVARSNRSIHNRLVLSKN